MHWSRLDDVLGQAGDLTGKVVVSCSLPMSRTTPSSWSPTPIRALRSSRGGLADPVVSAFHTVPSEVLFDVFAARKRVRRPSLVYCGDNRKAKKVAATLIRDVGFDPMDVGPLRTARYTEPFSLVIAQLAYEGRGGPELAYRFERFGERA